MSVSICSNCLSRLRLSSNLTNPLPALPLVKASSFHSSTLRCAQPLKKKSGVLAPAKFREAKSAKIKRKVKERPRPPPVGERRAARQRIVLSNTNALEIHGMEDLNISNMSNVEKIGQVLGLEGPVLDQLREAKAFKTTQNWNMFRRPATLIRTDTRCLGQDIEFVNKTQQGQESDTKFSRQILDGEKVAGKSMLLLQAMYMAFINDWVVISIPEGQDYTIGHSSYAPLTSKESSKDEQMYAQPHLMAELLSRIAYANDKVLTQLKLNHDLAKSLPIKKNMSLKDLVLLGANDHTISSTVWQAFWRELTEKGSKNNSRPPVLVAIDGLDFWMGPTKYRSAEYEVIHAQQFTLIQQFTSLLFSKKATSLNGGMILAATTGSNKPTNPSFALLLQQIQARAAGITTTDAKFPMPKPYSQIDQRVLNLFEGSNETIVKTITGLSRTESKGLLEYYAQSGIFKDRITDSLVNEKWTLSAGGIIGEIAKYGQRLRV